MTTAQSFWIDEYARKGASANPFAQSGRSPETDVVTFLHTVRHILKLLQMDPAHCLLDVGCGNGLVDIILAAHCREITAIERVPSLVETARANTAACGNVTVHCADGSESLGPGRAYDRALVWGALQLMTPDETWSLFERLADACPAGRVVVGSIPDARRKDAFLTPYLDGVRRSDRLSAAEKNAIIERNAQAYWYHPQALVDWWTAVGASAAAHNVPEVLGAADHRFDLVVDLGPN